MEKTIFEMCREISDDIVAIRRDLHMHPEEGMTCVRTTEQVCKELDRLGVSYRRTGEVGVIAEIQGTKSDSDVTVMLRGDMDALLQEEMTGLEYASVIPGKMHACGHDFHTSMLLGAIRVLNEMKDSFAGTVRFVFQPAEEINIGAKYMIEHGAMEGVDMVFGCHVDPLLPVGKVKCKAGPDWAAVDRFYITVNGTGAHGAMPHTGCDATVAAAAIAMNLQTMVSRECDPMKPLVVTVGQLHSGTAYNIISQSAFLEGTCRSFDNDVWEKIPETMERIAKHTAEALKCTAEVELQRMTRPLINDEYAYELLKGAAYKVLEQPEDLLPASPETVGEDFSEYSKYAPVIFCHLGADGGYPLHNSYINFKEDCIPYGMALEVQFALDALDALSRK